MELQRVGRQVRVWVWVGVDIDTYLSGHISSIGGGEADGVEVHRSTFSRFLAGKKALLDAGIPSTGCRVDEM